LNVLAVNSDSENLKNGKKNLFVASYKCEGRVLNTKNIVDFVWIARGS
jgi:hypothetical protein